MANEPKVAIFSLMRNRSPRIAEYIEKMNALEYENWTVNVCEGDSTDNTYTLLKDWEKKEPRVKIFKLDLHKRLYGSVICPERFWILGTCNDFILNDLAADESIDYFMYFQMDLRAPTSIITDLMKNDKDVVSPMIWCNKVFYDIWAFEGTNGQKWPSGGRDWYINNGKIDLVPMNCVGSMFLAKGEVLRSGARFGLKEDVRGFCKHARELGYKVWADGRIDVAHV